MGPCSFLQMHCATIVTACQIIKQSFDFLLSLTHINFLSYILQLTYCWLAIQLICPSHGCLCNCTICRARSSWYLLSIGDVSRWGDGSVVKVFILIHPHLCCSPRVPERDERQENEGRMTDKEKMGRGVTGDKKTRARKIRLEEEIKTESDRKRTSDRGLKKRGR